VIAVVVEDIKGVVADVEKGITEVVTVVVEDIT
jgi:hypothetical protein